MPAEVKIVCALLPGVGLAYVLLATIILLTSEASPRTLMVPLTTLLLGAIVAAGVARGMPFARLAGFAIVVIFGILHAFFLAAAATVVIKIFSILAAAGYIYSGVLLNSMPLRRFVLGAKA
ncbi:hypothetical protein CFN78_25280 [Amycolatopsis antarctica]|uniref:Uncharacterized protein n=2 Tax=Amycolatopsis antarctica TaxID=1854586 RepID=A0A263CZE4_9PSEU|nr:hypothetical protein CFN78_25280 [Amycolatopsis antarctica]